MNISELISALKRTPLTKWSFGHGKYVMRVRSIDRWIKRYSSSKGIYISSQENTEYPEVTGYFLETLLKWGYVDQADSWFKWLTSIQNKDGGWPSPNLNEESMFFDSGQIARGLNYYAKHYNVAEPASIKKFLAYFDANKEECLIPSSSNLAEVSWHLTNLQIAWIVGNNWPHHINLGWLEKSLKPYFAKWDVGYQNSHFDIYILEAMHGLGIFPKQFDKYLAYFDEQVKTYGVVPYSRENSAPCFTATAQLGVLYHRMGRQKEAHTIMFKMLDMLDIKKGNWPGAGKGTGYYENAEISWGLKYFLDLMYDFSISAFDLDVESEWTTVTDPLHERVLSVIESHTQPKSTMLDVGCGLGRYMAMLESKHDMYGADISEGNVKACRKKKLRVAGTSCTELRLPPSFPQKYDLIYAVEAFEHKVFPVNFLIQAKRLLKRRGKIIIVDKDLYQCLDYRLYPFESYYTKKEMRQLAKSAGMYVESFAEISPFFATVIRK